MTINRPKKKIYHRQKDPLLSVNEVTNIVNPYNEKERSGLPNQRDIAIK